MPAEQPSDTPHTPLVSSASTSDSDVPASPASRGTSRLRAIAASICGLTVGLGITELAFRARDGGAFPLVNVYERDEARGVRLKPGSVTMVGRRGERAIEVRVNREGYRGAEWPAPAQGEVIVIGDSLSFGLGVSEEEALAPRLAGKLRGKLSGKLSGAPVLDASVPTYGPPEYLATMEQVLARRAPGVVVLVVNAINDFAEIDRPNRERHVAVDGWAARVDEGHAARVDEGSPLGEALIRRSHAAFALWRWQRMREGSSAPPHAEGGIEALTRAARSAAGAATMDDGQRRAIEARRAERAAAEEELAAARRGVVELVRAITPYQSFASPYAREREAYLRAEGDPEDQVFELRYGGCGFIGRRGSADYRARFEGARIRADIEQLLRDMAKSSSLALDKRQAIDAAFARREAAAAKVRALAAEPPPPAPAERAPLPLDPLLARAREIAAARGAKLVVAVVPLDAQISDEAREARGIAREDAAAIDALLAEVSASARAAGAIGLDATPALKAEGQAAFLPDGHLSAKGHEALAAALAQVIAEAIAHESQGSHESQGANGSHG